MSKCSTLTTNLNVFEIKESDIVNAPYDPVHFFCVKKSKKLFSCEVRFPSGATGASDKIDFEISNEHKGQLFLSNNNGADYIRIDKFDKAAASITRVLLEKLVSARVCRGEYHLLNKCPR